MESPRKRTTGEVTVPTVHYRMCGEKSGAPPMRVSALQALFERLRSVVPSSHKIYLYSRSERYDVRHGKVGSYWDGFRIGEGVHEKPCTTETNLFETEV